MSHLEKNLGEEERGWRGCGVPAKAGVVVGGSCRAHLSRNLQGVRSGCRKLEGIYS